MPETDVATERELRAQLASKFGQLIDDIEPIAKAGTNTHFNYNFVREEDLVRALREKMSQHSLAVLFEARSESYRPAGKSGESGITTLEIGYRLIDTETGFEITGSWIGQGQDGQDKGVYKAMTGGIKYWFLKNLLIPTGDDPERTTKADKQHPPRQQRQQGGGRSSGGQQQRSEPHQKAIDWISSTLHDERFPQDLQIDYRGRGRPESAVAFFQNETMRGKVNRYEDAALDAAKALNAALKAAGSPLASDRSQGQGKQAPAAEPQRSHPQAQPPRPPATSSSPDPRPISQPQEKRLWAIATKAGWTNDAVHLLIGEHKNRYEHTKDIQRGDYDELIKKLESTELADRMNAEAEERADEAPTSGPRSR